MSRVQNLLPTVPTPRRDSGGASPADGPDFDTLLSQAAATEQRKPGPSPTPMSDRRAAGERSRTHQPRSASEQSRTERPDTERPGADRPGLERPGLERPGTEHREHERTSIRTSRKAARDRAETADRAKDADQVDEYGPTAGDLDVEPTEPLATATTTESGSILVTGPGPDGLVDAALLAAIVAPLTPAATNDPAADLAVAGTDVPTESISPAQTRTRTTAGGSGANTSVLGTGIPGPTPVAVDVLPDFGSAGANPATTAVLDPTATGPRIIGSTPMPDPTAAPDPTATPGPTGSTATTSPSGPTTTPGPAGSTTTPSPAGSTTTPSPSDPIPTPDPTSSTTPPDAAGPIVTQNPTGPTTTPDPTGPTPTPDPPTPDPAPGSTGVANAPTSPTPTVAPAIVAEVYGTEIVAAKPDSSIVTEQDGTLAVPTIAADGRQASGPIDGTSSGGGALAPIAVAATMNPAGPVTDPGRTSGTTGVGVGVGVGVGSIGSGPDRTGANRAGADATGPDAQSDPDPAGAPVLLPSVAATEATPTTTTPPPVTVAVTGVNGPTAEASAPAEGSTRTSEITDQVSAQIGRQLQGVRTLHDGTHHTVLRLSPEHLGDVTITLDVRAGGVRLDLAAGPVALAALQADLGQLRDDLAGSGLDLGDVTLSSSDPGAGSGTNGQTSARERWADPTASGQGRPGGQGRPDGFGAQTGTAPADDPTPARRTGRPGAGGLDVLA